MRSECERGRGGFPARPEPDLKRVRHEFLRDLDDAAEAPEHRALGPDEHQRGRVARARRDRAGGAEEGEVRHGSRRSASGSKSASGRFVLTCTERTVNSISSLPPTNSSCRYGKKKPPGSGRCSENARSSVVGPVGSVSRGANVTKRMTPY